MKPNVLLQVSACHTLCTIGAFTSYLDSSKTCRGGGRVLWRDEARSLELDGYRKPKVEAMAGGLYRKLGWLRSAPTRSELEAGQGRMVIVGASGMEGSLEVARGAGLQAGFVLIQKDVRCCYV
jgi:hypothetical protein